MTPCLLVPKGNSVGGSSICFPALAVVRGDASAVKRSQTRWENCCCCYLPCYFFFSFSFIFFFLGNLWRSEEYRPSDSELCLTVRT